MQLYLSKYALLATALHALTAVAPTGAWSTQGWTVGTNAAPKYCVFRPDTVQSAAAFAASEPTPFSQYGYRSPDPLTGVFAAGVWQLTVKVQSSSAYYAQTGYVKFRLWKGAAANGAGATEITGGWQTSSLVSFTAGLQYQTRSISTAALAEVSLAGEYLFVELEWSAVAAGGNPAAAVYFVANENVEYLITPTWTAPQEVSGGSVAGGDAAVGMHTSEAMSGGVVAGGEAVVGSHVSEVMAGGSVAGGEAICNVSPMAVANLAYPAEPMTVAGLRLT